MDTPPDRLERPDAGTRAPLPGARLSVEGSFGDASSTFPVLAEGRTDAEGHFSRYKVVDPSFHNWTGLAMALRNQQISDFPLCNKSFNLSYCGHDL